LENYTRGCYLGGCELLRIRIYPEYKGRDVTANDTEKNETVKQEAIDNVAQYLIRIIGSMDKLRESIDALNRRFLNMETRNNIERKLKRNKGIVR
jgi:hypothetical protein